MTWTTDSGKELRTFDNSLIPSSTELDTKETRIKGRFVLIRSHVIILYCKLHFNHLLAFLDLFQHKDRGGGSSITRFEFNAMFALHWDNRMSRGSQGANK